MAIIDALWTCVLMRGMREVLWDVCWSLSGGLCKLDNTSPYPIILIDRPSPAFFMLYSLPLLGTIDEESSILIRKSVRSTMSVPEHLSRLQKS